MCKYIHMPSLESQHKMPGEVHAGKEKHMACVSSSRTLSKKL